MLERGDARLRFRICLSERGQHGDAPNALGLLPARPERPRDGRATEQCDELAPLHSVTSSARAGGANQPLSSRLSSLRKRQSVPSATILAGLDLIKLPS